MLVREAHTAWKKGTGPIQRIDEATTLKSVLRDVVGRCAENCRGRVVLDRLDDDILAEFRQTRDAITQLVPRPRTCSCEYFESAR